MYSLSSIEWVFTVVATSFSFQTPAISRLQNYKLTIVFLRLHRRVRNHRRSQIRKDRSPAQRTSQQNRRHFSPIQHPSEPDRKLGQLVAPSSFIRLHHLGMPPFQPRFQATDQRTFQDYFFRHYGPRRGSPQKRRRQASRICLLKYIRYRHLHVVFFLWLSPCTSMQICKHTHIPSRATPQQ